MLKAVFPGSFDPFHEGHLYVLKKSLSFFDSIIVLVSNNSLKKHKSSLQDRKEYILKYLKKNNISNVIVETNDGLTMEYCKKNNIIFLVRGIRDKNDIEYEQNLYHQYKEINSKIVIVYFYSTKNLINIHSTN